MTVGNMISAICKYASDEDTLLLARGVYGIYEKHGKIVIELNDGEYPDIVIEVE